MNAKTSCGAIARAAGKAGKSLARVLQGLRAAIRQRQMEDAECAPYSLVALWDDLKERRAHKRSNSKLWNDSKLNTPATSPASDGSAWLDGKTHKGTDGETTARRRVINGRVELEIKDGDGWLRCMGDGYFTPNDQDQVPPGSGSSKARETL